MVGVIILDGPQGWRDPRVGPGHSRKCEKALNTPAKTGEPGVVKPGGYAPYVAFSVDVFDALHERSWRRLSSSEDMTTGANITVESFPMAAWKSLGLQPLPAKTKTTTDDIQDRIAKLKALVSLKLRRAPNHDELQALVGGLAAIEAASDVGLSTKLHGVAPHLLDGSVSYIDGDDGAVRHWVIVSCC